jgi:hypothetical protein
VGGVVACVVRDLPKARQRPLLTADLRIVVVSLAIEALQPAVTLVQCCIAS